MNDKYINLTTGNLSSLSHISYYYYSESHSAHSIN